MCFDLICIWRLTFFTSLFDDLSSLYTDYELILILFQSLRIAYMQPWSDKNDHEIFHVVFPVSVQWVFQN